MQIYLDQLGCRLNYSEMDTLAGRLQAVGHTVVPAPEAAQVIVLNTCAVTAGAVSKSRQTVRRLHARNPTARIALTGCFASLEPEAAAALPGVALVAHNQEKDLLPLLLEAWSTELDDPDQLERIQPDGTPFGAPIVPAPTAGSRTARPLAPRSSLQPRPAARVAPALSSKCRMAATTAAPSASLPRPGGTAAAAPWQRSWPRYASWSHRAPRRPC